MQYFYKAFVYKAYLNNRKTYVFRGLNTIFDDVPKPSENQF